MRKIRHVRRSSILGGRGALVAAAALAGSLVAGGCADARVYPIRAGGGGAGPPLVCPADQLVGFATLGNGTTGGAAGDTVLAQSLADLQTYAAHPEPLTIQVNGMFTLAGQLDVASDKTLVGVGTASGLTGGGFRIKDGHNVIFQNLVVSKAVGTDAIQIQNAQNIWVTHCDLSSDRDNGKDYYDGLVDISHASDFITVSWTRLHDHFHCSLVGHSASNGAEDSGHLDVTYHHDLFQNTDSELPRVRFGDVHVFNNHYVNVALYAVASQMGAAVLVERSVFDTVVVPVLTHYDDPQDGTAHETDDLSVGSGASQITADTTWTPPYSYVDDLDLVDSVPVTVDSCAGVRQP